MFDKRIIIGSFIALGLVLFGACCITTVVFTEIIMPIYLIKSGYAWGAYGWWGIQVIALIFGILKSQVLCGKCLDGM